MNKNEENGLSDEIEDISEDVEDIGQDTDKILKHTNSLLVSIQKQQVSILDAINAAKQNKKWIQGLFCVDKAIMLLLMLASLLLGKMFL